MTDDSKALVWKNIYEQQSDLTLSGDERTNLEKLLRTPLMLKVLGTIYTVSREQSSQFLTVDFSDPKECHLASKVQGHVQASIGLIDMMMQLTDDAKEDSDGE